MAKYLITTFSIFILTIGAVAQIKSDYIVFYKPDTHKRETNLYNSPTIKFDFKTQYENLKNADVKNDFDRAISHKDCRVIVVSGYDFVFPGIPDRALNKFWKDQNFKVVEGTSDVINGDDPPLQTVAYEYTKKYNALMLAYIKTHKIKLPLKWNN